MDRQTSLTDFSAIFTELSILSCLYYQFSLMQTDIQMELRPLPWVAMALVSFLLNLWFTRRGSFTLPQLTLINLPLFGVSLWLMLWRFSYIEGVAAYLFAALFVGIVSLRCAYLCVTPPPLERYLSETECAIFGAALLLLMQTGLEQLPPVYPVCLFVAVILCFFSNVRERVRSAGARTVAAARWHGVIALTAFGAVAGGLLLTAGVVFAQPARAGLQTAVHAGSNALSAIGKAILRILEWLVSLFPPPDPGEMMLGDPAAGLAAGAQGEQTLEPVPGWIIVLVGVVLAVLVIAAVIWLSRRMRFGKLTRKVYSGGRVRTVTGKLMPAFQAWLARLGKYLRLWRDAVRHRNTPWGLFLWANWQGKRRGYPKGAGEPARAYLGRLFAAATQTAELAAFCDTLESVCFGGRESPLDKAMLRRLRRRLRKALPKPVKRERERERTSAEAHS